jgi:hypothetical protein
MSTKAPAAPTFNPARAQDIDQDTILEATAALSGTKYPAIQFVNGKSNLAELGNDKLGFSGGFMLVIDTNDKNDKQSDEETADKQAIADILIAAKGSEWQAAKYTFHNGTVANVVWKRQAGFSFCVDRRAWITEVNGERKYFAWTGYKTAEAESDPGKRPSSRSQFLTLVKGAEEAGPLMLTFSGNAGKAFDAILLQFQGTVMAAANALQAAWAAGQKPPVDAKRFAPRCFYLPVGASRNDDGSPEFITVGKGDASSMVTPPQMVGVPENASEVSAAILGALSVSDENLGIASAIVEDNQDWKKAWDSFDNQGLTSADEEPAEKVTDQIAEGGASTLANLGI